MVDAIGGDGASPGELRKGIERGAALRGNVTAHQFPGRASPDQQFRRGAGVIRRKLWSVARKLGSSGYGRGC